MANIRKPDVCGADLATTEVKGGRTIKTKAHCQSKSFQEIFSGSGELLGYICTLCMTPHGSGFPAFCKKCNNSLAHTFECMAISTGLVHLFLSTKSTYCNGTLPDLGTRVSHDLKRVNCQECITEWNKRIGNGGQIGLISPSIGAGSVCINTTDPHSVPSVAATSNLPNEPTIQHSSPAPKPKQTRNRKKKDSAATLMTKGSAGTMDKTSATAKDRG